MSLEQRAKLLRLRRHFDRVEWDTLVFTIEEDIPGFCIRYKNECPARGLSLYPVVWFESRAQVFKDLPVRVLEQEWVRLKDAKTFFGWFPQLPPWVNSKMYTLAYLFPQVLAPVAILGFVHPAFYFFLVCALPLPAPFRAYAEARAYRRGIELGEHLEDYVKTFTGPTYYWMLPSKRVAQKWLTGPSPYLKEMGPSLHTKGASERRGPQQQGRPR